MFLMCLEFRSARISRTHLNGKDRIRRRGEERREREKGGERDIGESEKKDERERSTAELRRGAAASPARRAVAAAVEAKPRTTSCRRADESGGAAAELQCSSEPGDRPGEQSRRIGSAEDSGSLRRGGRGRWRSGKPAAQLRRRAVRTAVPAPGGGATATEDADEETAAATR
ncbi:hypothetical protein Scep_014888 [Stephania cephalantha]|uniref:Uncharacterized protein n=1 Tax=Stephania cephalantha TaxID=152367 RepID=A0AAP0J1V8_9MAGN